MTNCNEYIYNTKLYVILQIRNAIKSQFVCERSINQFHNSFASVFCFRRGEDEDAQNVALPRVLLEIQIIFSFIKSHPLN